MSAYPDLQRILAQANEFLDRWEESFGPFERHPALSVDDERIGEVLEVFLGRLTASPAADGGNYPFFHPRYAGQMLKPPHSVAVAAYAAAMRINPNNHALDGGPPTAQMEKEVVADIAGMFGFPPDHLGHLTGGGTVANLEALYCARELHPKKGIAYSSDAHYTHGRMAAVLRMEAKSVACTPEGRIDLNALEDVLKAGDVGTVVLTAGTTGLGIVDPIADALPLLNSHGVRLHVDAAYGGFFALLDENSGIENFPYLHFGAISEADSVVVDPHKHGLQPYGCGCVLFRDPSVGRFYRHDSPYTYFTSDELHLGEISLECSRPGAAAAALWFTLQCFPLNANDGLGPVLKAGVRASRKWADMVQQSSVLELLVRPETDILAYFPKHDSLAKVDAASQAVFERGMADKIDPVFLSTYRMAAERMQALKPHLRPDASAVRILRSVLMKPEHEQYVQKLHERVEALAE
ncbi:MAG: aminotransferase class V-fold PLP-dependent enzyme [Rubricoccaceae bacterium]|nr:aminotransferase class V-fold PLP-dependent enzyme [Rubricoccaceae bacterium]